MRIGPDTLRRAPAFAALPPEALSALALCFTERRYASGEVVFREGDPAAGMLFLVEGELTVTARVNGAPREIGYVAPGQLLGEASLIDPTPRPATVKAKRASTVFELGDDAIGILKRASPPAARALLGAAIRAVARRLHRLEQRVERELERGAGLP